MTARKPHEREDVAEHLREPKTTLDASDAAVATDEVQGPDLPNIPFIDASDATHASEATVETKPTWRGWIHAGTFPLTIVAGIVLVSLAQGAPAKWTSAVFTLTSMLLFGSSALYHRINWQPRAKVVLKRIDHANIFLLIAGSYTPITVLSLQHDKAVLLLWLVWGGAGLGILFRVFWVGAPRWLYVPLYVLLGYASLAFIVDFFQANAIMMTLILVGGLLYTAGAVIYGLKRPNPVPGVFGFHEIFHTLTLLAFLCHWTGIFLVATNPPVLG
jgi:hemolysin III